MVSHPFIVLEGLSGTGKSTIARLLAEAIGGIVYHTPPLPFAAFRDAVDRTCDPASRYFFYLAGIVHASREIQTLLQVHPVICDRYLLTTHCWHLVKGVGVLPDYTRLGILRPDLTVLVTCGEDERQRRLDTRGWSYNDVQERQDQLDEVFLQAYHACGIVEIDNSTRDPLIAVRQILGKVVTVTLGNEDGSYPDDSCNRR